MLWGKENFPQSNPNRIEDRVGYCGRGRALGCLAAALFSAGNTEDLTWAYYTSLGLSLLTLFSLGLFLGRISHGRMVVYGFKSVRVGVLSIVISYFFGVSGC